MTCKFEYSLLCILSLFLIASCNFRKGGNEEDRVIAEIKGETLYYSQIRPIAESASGTSDSAGIVTKYIEDWIKRKLMIQKALLYLPEDEYNVEKQVKDYRESLLLYLYEKELILQKLDTGINEQKLRDYYENYKNNFELAEDIVQLSYIKMPADVPDIDSIMYWFSSQKEEYRMRLEDYCYRYASEFSFSDTLWVTVSSVYRTFPVREEQFSMISRNKTISVVSDPLYVYVLKVNDTKSKGEISPYHFVKDDITRITLNKRKVELVRKTYDNLYLEALSKKDFKIYE